MDEHGICEKHIKLTTLKMDYNILKTSKKMNLTISIVMNVKCVHLEKALNVEYKLCYHISN